jgi:5-methylcytosine-specific restriction endonuclease McrA
MPVIASECRRSGEVKKNVQRAMYCRCGNQKILANGLCSTCYTLKRQDEEYFGRLREAVLRRDGYCCRVCGASGRRKRSIVVHHRVPGKSLLHLMISLCPSCHAKVGRTQLVLSEMPPLLLELWREQHPEGHEQTTLNFRASGPAAEAVPLFTAEKEQLS